MSTENKLFYNSDTSLSHGWKTLKERKLKKYLTQAINSTYSHIKWFCDYLCKLYINKAIIKFLFYTFYCSLGVTGALPWDNRHPNGFIFPPLNILILTCSKTYRILGQSWLLAKYMLCVQTFASLSRWGAVSKRSISVDWRDGLRAGVQPFRIPPTSKTSASISRATVYFHLCSELAQPRDSFSPWVEPSAHRGSGSLHAGSIWGPGDAVGPTTPWPIETLRGSTT